MPPLNQVAQQSGFGAWTGFGPVTNGAASPNNAVLGNVGIARSIISGGAPIRITHIGYRVDLAPDLAAGTVNVPLRWRLVVLADKLPSDITAFQQQAFAAGAHPEIPADLAVSASPQILLDRWLDFGAGDPGLNQVAVIDLADAGPVVAGNGSTITVLLCPIIDANLSQTLPGAANALLYLEVFGRSTDAIGNSSAPTGTKSLPRWGVGQE